MFKNARKVHVGEQVYYWTVVSPGHGVNRGIPGKVGIHTPSGKNFFPTWSEVTGFTEEQIKNRAWPCDICDGPCVNWEPGQIIFEITPGMVKDYVERHIHGKS